MGVKFLPDAKGRKHIPVYRRKVMCGTCLQVKSGMHFRWQGQTPHRDCLMCTREKNEPR